RGVADADLEAARFEAAGRVLDLARRVREAYHAYQAAEQIAELARTEQESAAAAYDLALRLADAGNISGLELATEQVFYEETRIEVARAEAEALGRREALNVLMGLAGPETGWAVAGPLAEPQEEPSAAAGLE